MTETTSSCAFQVYAFLVVHATQFKGRHWSLIHLMRTILNMFRIMFCPKSSYFAIYFAQKQQAAHFKRLFHRKFVDTQSTASVTAKNKSASLFTYIFVLTFRGLHLFFFFLLSLASQEFITRLMLMYSDHSGYTENSVISFPWQMPLRIRNVNDLNI